MATKKVIKRQKYGLLQTAQKTKDKATQSPLKTEENLKVQSNNNTP
jgi:hypothetical protein